MTTAPPDKPSLEETMKAMHAMLRGQATPEATSTALGAPVNRLSAYQGMVSGHVRGILAKNYRTLPALMDCCAWDALTQAYFDEVPAAEYELNRVSEPFPEWLASRIEAGESDLTEFHVELCQLEWAEFEAFADEERLPDPAKLRKPALNPTLRVLEFRYPVAEFLAQWLRSNEANRPVVPTEPAPQVVFVFREPKTQNHRFERATDNSLFAFKAVHDGMTVREAADAAGAPVETVQAVLAEAAESGLIFLPESS